MIKKCLFLQQVFCAVDLLLNSEQQHCVPRIKPGDGVVLLDLFGERVHIVVFGATDQTLKKPKQKISY